MPGRILVVEDSVELAEMVKEVLEGKGFDVAVAYTGQEGIDKFRREPFDVVVQDVNLPGGISGYGACQAYKTIRDSVAVLMMTGDFKSDQDEEIARRLGADGFLRKPFSPAQLLEVVNAVHKDQQHAGVFPTMTCKGCGAKFLLQEAIPIDEDTPIRVTCPNCGQVSMVRRKELTWDAPTERQGPHGPQARRVLVVEDSEVFRQFIGLILKRAGHVVLEARNGKEGLEFVGRWHPHLIVTDILVPEVDGIQLCRTLKQTPETAAIPIIIVTSFQTAAYREQAQEMGVAAYMTKPLNPQLFLEAVGKLVSR
ncbi:MAG: response regulator [Candidatus Methylomirabilales bacterium]